MTIHEYIRVAQRYWTVLVAGLALGLMAAGAATYLRPAQYAAEVTVFVSARPDTPGTAAAVEGNDVAISRLTTYSELLTSPRLAVEVAERLDGPPLSAQEVAGRITIVPSPDTMLLTARATDASPQRAAQIANLVADRLITTIENLEARPDGTGPAITAQVFAPARPATEPVSPRPMFNVLLGIVLGLVLGMAGAVFMDERALHHETRGVGNRPQAAVDPDAG